MTQTCTCGRPVPDGYLCRDCTSLLWSALNRYDETRDELETTRTRQARTASIGGRSDGNSLPWHNAASLALDTLADLCWDLVDATRRHGIPSTEQTYRTPTPTALESAPAWLAVRVDGIARHEEPTVLAVSLIEHDRFAWQIIDRPPELVFAGQCDLCGTHLYAVTGQAFTTCPTCRQPNDVALRRAAMLHAVRDRLVTGREAATALTTLELPVTVERIRQWVHRRRLIVRAHTPDRHRLYRLGDIIDLLTVESARMQTTSLA